MGREPVYSWNSVSTNPRCVLRSRGFTSGHRRPLLSGPESLSIRGTTTCLFTCMHACIYAGPWWRIPGD